MTDWLSGSADPGPLPSGGSAYDERLALLDAARLVHAEVSRLALPLDVPGAAQMRRERESVLRLVEGYLVGRLVHPDRPLLAVIGGPTGAGKSTILNSLVGAPVSPASVLRPTTRTPVLLYHPDDERALLGQQLLPELETVRGGEPDDVDEAGLTPGHVGGNSIAGRRIRLVPRREIPVGLAVLDSPDLDSWLTTNRELATALLGIADLWIFATTGTDYADAVPWALLDTITNRRVTIAAVLNRMRQNEITAVRQHFAHMLTERGLASTPVFTIPELQLVDERIPYEYLHQLDNWLARQSGIDDVREAYLDRAVRGTLDQVLAGLRRLVDAAADQVVAERRLRVDLKVIFEAAREETHALVTGQAAAPALRAVWTAVGETSSGGGFMRRLGAALRPPESPYAVIGGAIRQMVATIARDQVSAAARQVSERWNDHPAAASVGAGALVDLPADVAERADALAVSWLTAVEDRLGERHERHASVPRWSAATVAVASLALAPSVDVGPAGTGHGEVRADDVREDLLARLDGLLADEQARLAVVLDRARIAPDGSAALRTHLESLERLQETAFRE